MKLKKLTTTLSLTATLSLAQTVCLSNQVKAQEGFNIVGVEGDLWTAPEITVSTGNPRVIPVCWEEGGFNIEKAWVKWAIEATWESVSAVNFTGWGNCRNNSDGIRIAIHDGHFDRNGDGIHNRGEYDAPHVFNFGNKLNGIPNGMVLNFTFNNWVPVCQDGGGIPLGFRNTNRIQSDSEREFCIKAIAVHEFGHALGLQHEQVREDTPDSCEDKTDPSGDFTIGKWDRDSIMNYCNPDWNGNGNLSATDIAGIRQLYGTPFAFQQKTGLHPTDHNFEFDLADWDRDGQLDLVAIKQNGTNSTEVHILSGRSNYQQFILQTGTALHETGNNFDFDVADWDQDGKPDLVAIKKSGTESRSTEVHILSGRSNYQQFILQTGTALHETGNNFDFDVADWNRDGKADVIAIKKSSTGTNSTEVHILSGSTNFGNFLLQTGTALHETGSNFAFISDDWDQDGYADLFAVKKSKTGTGKTEVHVVSAASYR